MKIIKASVIHELNGKFITEKIKIDTPKNQEVLVDVKASGLCHSDLHIVKDGHGFTFPAVLGHEIAGVVCEVGDQVTDFFIGDHVAASLIQFCGLCRNCLEGLTYICEKQNQYTVRTDKVNNPRLRNINDTPLIQGFGIAGFAEYSLVHQNQLVKIPQEIAFKQASVLGCGTITGAGAVINTAKIRPGETVAVIGVGGVGLNSISGALIAGATIIIAIDLDDNKLEQAKKFGATHTINASIVDPVAEVIKITQGGVDAAFEVIGLSKTSEQAIAMTRKTGTAYLIGLISPHDHTELPTYTEFIGQGKKVVGVRMGSTNIKRDIPMYAELYRQNRMNLDDLIDHEINICDVQDAYEELARGHVNGRIVITSF